MDQFSSDKLNDIAELYESIHYGTSEAEVLNEVGQPGAGGYAGARNQRIQAQGQVKTALGQGKGIGLQSASGVGQGTGQGQKAFGTQLGGRQGVIVKGAAAGPNLGPRGGSSFTRAANTVNVGGQTLYKAQKGKDVVYLQGKGGPQLFKSGAKPVVPPGRNPPPPGGGGNQPPSGRTQPPAGGGSKVLPTKPAGAPAEAPKPAIGKLGNTSFERRTPTSAELRAAQTARAGGASPEKALQAAQKTNLPTQGPTPAIPSASSVAADVAKANSPAVINRPAPAGSALARQQAAQRPATTAQATAAAPSASPAASGSVVPPTNAIAAAPRPKPMVPARAPAGAPLRPEPLFQSYDYEDVYDLVLEYLITEGYADTEESATAIMANMSEEWRESIVEAKVDEKLPEHERSGARLSRYDNPSGALALGGGQQRARREEHKERRGKKTKG